MAHSDLPYNHGAPRPAIQSWHTQTYHTIMAHSDVTYKHGTLRRPIQSWHTQTCYTDMAHSDLPYNYGTLRPAIQSWHTQTCHVTLHQLNKGAVYSQCVTWQYKAVCGRIGDRIATNAL